MSEECECVSWKYGALKTAYLKEDFQDLGPADKRHWQLQYKSNTKGWLGVAWAGHITRRMNQP